MIGEGDRLELMQSITQYSHSNFSRISKENIFICSGASQEGIKNVLEACYSHLSSVSAEQGGNHDCVSHEFYDEDTGESWSVE